MKLRHQILMISLLSYSTHSSHVCCLTYDSCTLFNFEMLHVLLLAPVAYLKSRREHRVSVVGLIQAD